MWPVSREAFHYKAVGNEAYRSGDHFVAEVDRRIVGFVGTQARLVPGEETPRGELMAILVDPLYQCRGIGRALLDKALTLLRQKSVADVQLGSGALGYFWAGVPTNLPGVWEFFQACGWSEAECTFDLTADIDGYATPAEMYERIHAAHIQLFPGAHSDTPAILAFEAVHFP